MKNLNVWRVHSQACKIKQAEKTCLGTANEAAVKWCGPYTSANQFGFWLYPPVDMQFVYDGNRFIYDTEKYSNEDYVTVKSLVKSSDKSVVEKWCMPDTGRTKFTWGAAEQNVVQIWTGLIFETPPGYCLQIRSPINFPKTDYHVMEAILETDWMHYDIWINLVCDTNNKQITITKDFPIAQLIPIKRESTKDWEIKEEHINRNTKKANYVFKYWLNYNKKKFENGGKQLLSSDGSLTKDSTTYFREKKRLLDGEDKPKCPYHNFIGKFFPKKH
jgi:hypothetical protein